MLSLVSHKNASRHGRPRPYLARLYANGEHLERDFAARKKSPTNGTISFSVKPKAGDIYEIRGWTWDSDRESYVGGTVWLGVQADGSLSKFTRQEAITAAFLTKIEKRSEPKNNTDIVPTKPSIIWPEFLKYERS